MKHKNRNLILWIEIVALLSVICLCFFACNTAEGDTETTAGTETLTQSGTIVEGSDLSANSEPATEAEAGTVAVTQGEDSLPSHEPVTEDGTALIPSVSESATQIAAEPSTTGTDIQETGEIVETLPETAEPGASEPQESETRDFEPVVTEAQTPEETTDAEPEESSREEHIITLPPDEPATEPDLELESSDVEKEALPRVDIKTEGGQSIQSKDYYVNSTISVSGCDEAYVLTDCAAGVRVRGNSTAAAPKKPYRIKFETKQSMLGLNDGEKFKSWCLMADYYDSSMLRTWATFTFAKVLLGGKYFSSDCTPVEVYVNGEYMGVYLLCEQTQIDNDRIDIYEAKDGDTSLEIGYLMIGQGGRNDEPESIVVWPEITVRDRTGAEMHFSGMNFALSGSGYTEEQKAYVSKYSSAVFKVVAAALYEDKYYNLDRDGNMTLRPKSELQGMTKQEKQISTIDAVFNIESAVRMCILDEIAKNLDAMTFNMYVDLSPFGDGRLTLAAPWDFDFAMANTHYSTTHSSSGFYATNLSYSEGMRTNLWYVMLGSIDWFEAMCEEVWQDYYPQLQSVAMEVLERTYKYADAYDRDWDKWGAGAHRSLIHHHCQEDLQSFRNHADAGRFLNSWLIARLKWLNRQWGDGVVEIAPEAPALQVDFTQDASAAYISGMKRAEGQITKKGLRLTLLEPRDPYFYVDFTNLSETYLADDYYILEIEYMMPVTNALGDYSCELFLCSGSLWDAVGGASVGANLEKADGKYHTLRIDLSESGYWNGDIHKIRIDFFNNCDVGDMMFIKSVKLLPR